MPDSIGPRTGTTDLSIIVPVYNEAPVLQEFFLRMGNVLRELREARGLTSEVLAVDDGSTDGSLRILQDLAREDGSLRVLHLEANRGQHEAIIVGLSEARAPLLVTIDADLQNPPEEIPHLVASLLQGHDLVAARRIRRHDPLSRRIVSRLANWTSAALTRFYTRVPLHDVGCMLRGYRRELVDRMLEASREPGAPAPFIPALALRFTRNACEIDVEHAPRGHGRSRYNWVGLLGLHLRLLSTLARGRRAGASTKRAGPV